MSPALSPAAALTTVAMALLFIGLSFRIIYLRLHHRVGLGDGGVKPLQKAIRVHGNFSEWVPVALLCMLAADLRGADPTWLQGLGILLVIARVCHIVGLTRSSASSIPRTAGVAGTVTVILTASGLVLASL